ncbi:MAG: SPOR domain-containing protein [Spirochaetaceae bacterium]|nr:SPOR domain-containing protein [Spirochaetaceae bacterium]
MAVSVGIFLIIVIGLSILIFLPKHEEPLVASRVVSRSGAGQETAALPERVEPASVDVMDMIRNREETQGLQQQPSEPQQQPASVPPRPALQPAPRTSGAPPAQVSGAGANSLVIEVPRPASAAAIPASSREPARVTDSARSPQISPPISTPPPPAPSSAGSASRPALPQSTAAPAAYKPPAPQPAARSPSRTPPPAREVYWVQAGSFSTQVRAEDVKETLSAKGITAIIENKDVNGSNVFRVRVGPYTSQSEADYWLAFIKTIKGFEGSQIWQSKS